ncbi:MAG: Fur family transcriptional regulator [Candidatus Egerieousia sp.]
MENSAKIIIQSKGLKATPQRIAVYNVMRRLGHASADMVCDELSITSSISHTKATVYNALESFAKAGIIDRRYSPNNKMYFDVNVSDHVHLLDEEGNTFRDYDSPELVELVKEFMKEKSIEGFAPRKIDIQIIGKELV